MHEEEEEEVDEEEDTNCQTLQVPSQLDEALVMMLKQVEWLKKKVDCECMD